jgi:hypothetical protein
MERETRRKLVVGGGIILAIIVQQLSLHWYSKKKQEKKRKTGEKKDIKISEFFLDLLYLFLPMFLLLLFPPLWAGYDERQERNEPIVKEKRKWEEVFPALIQELVSELEKGMEKEGEHRVILLEDTPSEIEDKINYFCNIWFDLGKGVIFQYLIDRKLIKRRTRWEENPRDLKIIFSQLIEISPAEAEEKIKEIENLLQDLYDKDNSDNSLRKQAREFLQLTEEEQLELWLRNFSFRLAVSKLLIEIYCSLRQKANKGGHYLYNWRYENIITSSVFY